MHHQVQLSDTTSIRDGGVGYTPSVMSPIKYGTGIGHLIGNAAQTARLGGDNTLYSQPSPLRLHA
jgi:hypothetical protein